MIVDTSALIAVTVGEPEWEALQAALLEPSASIPAPVLTELALVTGAKSPAIRDAARGLVDTLILKGCEIAAFDHRHAEIARTARDRYGRANGRGGLLNFGDLMVYAIAKQRGEPVLCTGRDFASTDLDIHPASRLAT